MPISWFFQTSNQISTMELRKMLMPFEHLKILGSIVVQLMAGAGYVAAAALCKLSNKSEATGGSAADHSRCDQVIFWNLWNWKYELRIIFRNKLSAMASPNGPFLFSWPAPDVRLRLWSITCTGPSCPTQLMDEFEAKVVTLPVPCWGMLGMFSAPGVCTGLESVLSSYQFLAVSKIQVDRMY